LSGLKKSGVFMPWFGFSKIGEGTQNGGLH